MQTQVTKNIFRYKLEDIIFGTDWTGQGEEQTRHDEGEERHYDGKFQTVSLMQLYLSSYSLLVSVGIKQVSTIIIRVPPGANLGQYNLPIKRRNLSIYGKFYK